MISEKLLGRIRVCIQLYDDKIWNDYVIVFGKGKKDTIKYCRITFNSYNFWHLLGCKLNGKNHLEIYEQCKKGEDISKELSLVHSYSEAYNKCDIFCKVFDFVSNAKCTKIGYVANCPEEFYLTMALGSEVGIIGFDYPKDNKKFLIPKSVQDKKISSMSKELNKILFILSKKQCQKSYSTIEYEIKEGVAKDYFMQISERIDVCNLYIGHIG